MNKCEIESSQKIFVFTEQRSTLRLINKNQVKSIRIEVDGCAITSGLRCDFMHIANNTEMYIELKGTDIAHAVKQIEETICKLGKDLIQNKICFIICARSPLVSTEIQALQWKLRKSHNAKLIIKSSPYEHQY
jgi:hypothetical protein